MDQSEIDCLTELAAASKKDPVQKLELMIDLGTLSVMVKVSKN